MTDPEVSGPLAAGSKPNSAPSAIAQGPQINRLTKRRDFLQCAAAFKAGKTLIGVQARFRDDGMPTIRIGYTATKRVGNAVLRNRAKRRMRALSQALIAEQGFAGCDYVWIARPITPEAEWGQLRDEARSALFQLKRALKRQYEPVPREADGAVPITPSASTRASLVKHTQSKP